MVIMNKVDYIFELFLIILRYIHIGGQKGFHILVVFNTVKLSFK